MAVINVLYKDLDLSKSELLYDFKTFDATDWQTTRNCPNWQVTEEAITGNVPENSSFRHGQIFYKTPVAGDIVLEFDARLIPPSYHDFVWLWNTKLEKDNFGSGYLGCLGGWFNNLAGIEKLPNYDSVAISPSFEVVPGQSYHIVSGRSGNLHFITVDGKMVTYFSDPASPAQDELGYFGFGVYQSNVEYRNLKVYRPYCTSHQWSY